MSKPCTWCAIFRAVLSDIAQGLFLVTHSGLAMVGLGVAACVLALWLNPEWLRASEEKLFNWLRERQVLVSWLPENAAERATAMNVRELPASQAACLHACQPARQAARSACPRSHVILSFASRFFVLTFCLLPFSSHHVFVAINTRGMPAKSSAAETPRHPV